MSPRRGTPVSERPSRQPFEVVMSRFLLRREHRSLPVLIAIGVLLGAGLALATPAGHRADPSTSRGRPSPSMSSRSPTASPSPAEDGGSAGGGSASRAGACAARFVPPGLTAGGR